jgi:hypothetical protein
MHYLERLICRAGAVPREMASEVFDPFEQVAPWGDAVDAPVKVAPAAPLASNTPPAEPPGSAAPVLERGGEVPHAKPATPAADGAQPMLLSAVAPAMPVLGTLIPVAPAPAAPMQPATTPTAAPLARADGFMRSLGIQQPVMQPAAPPRATPPAEPPSAPLVQAGPSPRANALERALPPLLRPVQPQALAPVMAPAAPPRGLAREAPAAREGQAHTARRSVPAAPPQRIVQTTVVLAPPSRRLDELAHGTAIARFGLGQQ